MLTRDIRQGKGWIVSENVISVENLVKRFDDFTAVDGVSFCVDRGICFGLLGPNGAGKTTVIRMLYGFSPPTGGKLEVFGMDIAAEWRKIRARIGVCQQDNTLDPDLTVEQNHLVVAGYFYISRNAAKRRADELLDFFALSHKKTARVMALSGGMVRRLMLARSLINQPDLLILDEPTTGLDPQSRHQVWEKLEALKQKGLTIVLTTHYMEEAARLCDRLVIVDRGRILIQGSPAALISRYTGKSVVEIEGPESDLMAYVRQHRIEHDDSGNRVILYMTDDSDRHRNVLKTFCSEKCTYRNSTLEDVFLRLTGRELRE